MVVPVRGYHFLFAFEEAGIWEELALASDGSLPRVDRGSDQPVCYSFALAPKVTGEFLVFPPQRPSQTSRPTFATINHISFIDVNFNSSVTK